MNSNTRKQIRNWSVLAGLVLIGITTYHYLTTSTTTTEAEEDKQTSNNSKKYTKKPITIILTESIISSNLPLLEILSKTEDIVIVIPPNLTKEDLNQEIPSQIQYKLIECDTTTGVWSVVQHLHSEIIFIVEDDLEDPIPKDLERYVGNIVSLEQNYNVINETILSHVFSP